MFFKRIMLTILCLFSYIVQNMECAVLDPALYLSPSPPLKLSGIDNSWSSSNNLGEINMNTELAQVKSRTFWPKVRTDYRFGSIHIPLTFSLSGTYGGQAAKGTAAVGTSYAVPSGFTKVISNTKTSLVGAQYDVLNSGVVRIYGGDTKPAWSGWGNGKWGHYGKG